MDKHVLALLEQHTVHWLVVCIHMCSSQNLGKVSARNLFKNMFNLYMPDGVSGSIDVPKW